MDNLRIAQATIVCGRFQNTVMVQLEDGSYRDLFDYYPDEISFHPTEFTGKTVDQGQDLFRVKDLAYLRS